MRLSAIAHALSVTLPLCSDPDVISVTHNSAWVEPGCLFVAMRGARHDGHSFIQDALARGAVAIVGEGFAGAPELPVPYLCVADARAALADSAACLYGNPSDHLTIVGVTGTKGKTTTAWLTRHLLQMGGHRVGLLSTLGYKLGDEELQHFPAHFTTPEAPQVQATLARILADGCTHAVVEASSEALAQQRLRGARFAAAIWTNLAPEHLNFHKTMEGYFAAKRILMDASPFQILNADDPWSMRLVDRPHATYACTSRAGADWQALHITELNEAVAFELRHPAGLVSLTLPLLGGYNVSNALAAMAAAAHLGVPMERMLLGIETFAGVPGRMQVIQAAPFRVVLDFAHTPPSLEAALTSLRRTTERRLIVVIGSAGGPRDPGKRAPLGETSARLADLAVLTEEDCRDTPIWDILNEMHRGAIESGLHNTTLIPDRYEAIRFAFAEAQPGDTVVLCGKAGEETLERATETLPWDEESIARELLNALA